MPNAAIFWYSYHRYCQLLSPPLVDDLNAPIILVQALSAPAAGITASTVTNCLDLYRARVQVRRSIVMILLNTFPVQVQRRTYLNTARTLWHDEGMNIFVKGLSARLVASCFFSLFMIVGYESVKRLAIADEYSDRIRW